MIVRIIGAICIMVACGSLGFSVAYKQLRELKLLDQWIRILDRMGNEIRCQLRPAPDLFRMIAYEEKGELSCVFLNIAIEIENQVQPDVRRCMDVVLSSLNTIPESVLNYLEQLGKEMGRYDLEGQLLGIEHIRTSAIERRDVLNRDKSKRIRGYQTLGLCAGAALVILFI